ncbi:MAG: tail fiber domain-containing protein [Deltaproteobacteria bacterium]|uniref:Tail fiber domain-containing protein n=1 Tax=Candidatus Desulfacyla euxinica TaxID=2841693 RepID=A0A8J6MXF7_9DELT|nr:tail fiber domain-containing protein [Candidatus Desulfacyla euxinica]
MKKLSFGKQRLGKLFTLSTIGLTSIVLLALFMFTILPTSAFGADKLVIKDGSGTTTFKVEDSGATTAASRLYTNGASGVGAAPFVLGQNIGNRGMIITDKAATNPKRIYFGWNTGATMEYVEIFALQEGVAYKNFVLAPFGGYVGIGTSNPSYPLQMGSGAYVTTGGVWTNASSREYKTDIKRLSTQKAIDTLKQLDPVEFAYKTDSQEKHVGFIAEDAPELVASKDKKGMSSMDVVAVLTKVVQEQQKTIAELSKKMSELERQLKLERNPTLASVGSSR